MKVFALICMVAIKKFRIAPPATILRRLRKAGICQALTSLASAQAIIGARAGLVNFTAGEVTVDGEPVQASGMNRPLLKSGQVIQTRNGRVELLIEATSRRVGRGSPFGHGPVPCPV